MLLKGADTIVQAPGSAPVLCDLGPPSLATAGSGDVLTGVVAAFLAKGLEPGHAAAAGAVAHGIAAASVPHQAGLVASDDRRPPRVLAEIRRLRAFDRHCGRTPRAELPLPGEVRVADSADLSSSKSRV